MDTKATQPSHLQLTETQKRKLRFKAKMAVKAKFAEAGYFGAVIASRFVTCEDDDDG